MSEIIYIIIAIVLTICTGYFVAAEFSLVNLDRAELEARKNKGEKKLNLTIQALKITSTHLSSAQLGITITTLLTGYTLEPALSSLLLPFFELFNLPDALNTAFAMIIALFIATFFSMLLGELIPKNLALALPLETAKKVMPFQTVFTNVFNYPIVLLNKSANKFLYSINVEPKEELSGARTAEELSALLKRSAQVGLLEHKIANLLDKSLKFSTRTAYDVMTPRLRVVSVSRQEKAYDVLSLSSNTGHSRLVVTDGDIDEIVGVVHVKQALAVPYDRRKTVPVGAITEDILRVPETMKLDNLLEELRKSTFQFAAVIDEYGGTAGLVTLEDLVEEIIGDIVDEHDRVRMEIIKREDGFSFHASLRVDEFIEKTGIDVPLDAPYDTMAGFFISASGTLPKTGMKSMTQIGELIVERMDGRRIDRLRLVIENKNNKNNVDSGDTNE